MCKKDKHIEQTNPTAEVQYPRYLSNQPQGEDLFEGKSQERLADAIVKHIIDTDKAEKPVFARLIGLEGKWGSGKSNVIKILENRLKGTYTFFNFDAWGNQEDLQRRSILELLTKFLIDGKKLMGKTKMRVLKSDDGKVVEDECSWDEKLESLLSRKSFTRNVTVPSVNDWTKTFVLMLLITGMLIPLMDLISQELSWNWYWHWWINLIIIFLPILTFIIIAWRKGKLVDMWKMYNTEGRSDTTSYVISEREPSVREFKGWMTDISNGIPEGEKLVIVFDNMDRLSSEKVHQFWSLIQTFFADADDGYKNIWCVVPYDENHLAAVFSDSEDNDASMDLLRGFLDKTFPLVYRVPEPIVADYNKLFVYLYRNAFGTIISDESLELVSQCYRIEHPVPNVRDIISFVNNNVRIERQWKDSVSPISRAIYVLKEDEMLRHQQVTSQAKDVFKLKESFTDEYLLGRAYYMDFAQILMGSVDIVAMQREITALVYGINPKNADQVLFKRFIQSCIAEKDKKASFAKYVDNPNFILLLNDVVRNLSVSEYSKIVPLINEIDVDNVFEDDKKLLQKIWNFFAARYLGINDSVTEYKEYEHILFSHVSAELAKRCVRTFCKRMVKNNDVGGAQLYEQLTKVFSEDYAQAFDANDICPASELSAKRFADYVERAKDEYKRFPFKTNSDELNQIIERTLDGAFPYLDVLTQLKEDNDYTVSEVGKYAVQELNLKKANASIVATLIAVQRIFYQKFQSNLDPAYINALWHEVHTDQKKESYDEIYTLKTIGVFEQLPDDDRHIGVLLDKVFFYSSTKQLIKEFISNASIRFRGKLLKKMITENIHDDDPNYPEFVEKWQLLVNSLGLSRDAIVRFADNWGYKTISEQENKKTYFTLLGDAAWIDTLLKENTPLAQALLAKCVNEMSQQPINQYLQPNTVNHTGSTYSQALQKLAATDYITPAIFGRMNEIAGQLLDFVAKSTTFNDLTWNALLDKVSYASISSKVGEIRNHILNGKSAYAMTPAKFQFLHGWLEQAEINAVSHCTDAANQILAKVVDDANCQAIIFARKEYYRPILANTLETASALHERLKQIVKDQGESEFTKYVRETLHYKDE